MRHVMKRLLQKRGHVHLLLSRAQPADAFPGKCADVVRAFLAKTEKHDGTLNDCE